MAIRHNTRMIRTELEGVFCRWIYFHLHLKMVWLGSGVVSVLDSGAEVPGSNRSRDAVG